MIFKFIKDLLVKAVVGFLEFQQKRGLAEIRRRLAVRYARFVQYAAVGVRRAAWGFTAVAAIGAGLTLLPITFTALVLGICDPDKWQTAMLIAGVVLGVFVLVYLGAGLSFLWVVSSEKSVRAILRADEVERQLRGDD